MYRKKQGCYTGEISARYYNKSISCDQGRAEILLQYYWFCNKVMEFSDPPKEED